MSTLLVKSKKIGLFSIFSSYSINKFLSFLANLLIVRLLSVDSYGIYGAVMNLYTLFTLFSGFGMGSSALIYGSEQRDPIQKHAIFAYTFRWGLIGSFLQSVTFVLYVLFFPIGIAEMRSYALYLFFLPVFSFTLSFIQILFRTQQNNEMFARLNTIQSVLTAFGTTIGAFWFGLSGLIIIRYLTFFIPIVYGFSKLGYTKTIVPLSKKLKKEIWEFSIKSGLTSCLNQIICLLDVALIVQLLKDPIMVAQYKVATLIPDNLYFIPNTLMVALVPLFSYHLADSDWIRHSFKKIWLINFLGQLLLLLLLWNLGPFVLIKLWGTNYWDCIPCFRILCISYFFLAAFRLISTNLLAVYKKVTFNLVIAFLTCILNIILDFILIPRFYMIGAALATCISVIFTSLLSFPYLTAFIFIKKGSKLTSS
ncbi:lipopolysaccharide biosynthesis protein [uncultured Dubosiella sp.]|uniref:lipopolysaccharide biosynthesis protein n=1 Tax=uncultured Dubosiella sp. TaxID=1937011 RepID=UPI002594FA4F|nr:oligosaccharide flippase family protein [uncultured Dubosiella sp.]